MPGSLPITARQSRQITVPGSLGHRDSLSWNHYRLLSMYYCKTLSLDHLATATHCPGITTDHCPCITVKHCPWITAKLFPTVFGSLSFDHCISQSFENCPCILVSLWITAHLSVREGHGPLSRPPAGWTKGSGNSHTDHLPRPACPLLSHCHGLGGKSTALTGTTKTGSSDSCTLCRSACGTCLKS